MRNRNDDLLDQVADYYSRKLSDHGVTHRGVDWNSEESQTIRFIELCKVIQPNQLNFSLNDLGCGYGALISFLLKNYESFEYLGIDISAEMIQAARQKNSTFKNTKFINSAEPDQTADYGIASGIFNVRLGRTDSDWSDYIQATLDVLDRTSKHGFAFNCLTSYSDADKKRDYLYYADPCKLFDLCKRRYSAQVALLHDYGLFEFTILVRKVL